MDRALSAVVATLLGGSGIIMLLSCRSPKGATPDSAPVRIDIEATPFPEATATGAAVPTPHPTLMLKLPELNPVVERVSPSVGTTSLPLAVVTPSATVPEPPTLVDSLSKFKVSVDEKRRPLLHYRFSESSQGEPSGGGEIPHE